MTEAEIRAAIVASPAIYALLPDTTAIAAALSVGLTRSVSLLISERGILEKFAYGPLAADAMLAKLEAFALTVHPLSSIVKRALKFLAQPEGLDIGSAATQSLLDALASYAVLTVEEVVAIKNIARSAYSISEFEVRVAIINDDGTLKI